MAQRRARWYIHAVKLPSSRYVWRYLSIRWKTTWEMSSAAVRLPVSFVR